MPGKNERIFAESSAPMAPAPSSPPDASDPQTALPVFRTCTAFDGERRVAAGPLDQVALSLQQMLARHPDFAPLVFDDCTGEVVDLDLRGTAEQLTAWLMLHRPPRAATTPASPDHAEDNPQATPAARGRGRPRLGVVAREVSLLPRHWEWLNSQPGSASVVLRRLVDEARRDSVRRDQRRQAQKAAYVVMSAMAGNRPHFEEATRALFAGDAPRFAALMAGWPPDIREYVAALAREAFDTPPVS